MSLVLSLFDLRCPPGISIYKHQCQNTNLKERTRKGCKDEERVRELREDAHEDKETDGAAGKQGGRGGAAHCQVTRDKCKINRLSQK